MQRTKINRKEIRNVNNFGVELELYNVDKSMLIQALSVKGIACSFEGYTHRVMNTWKLVTDSSIQGENSYELVSPILNGMGGLKELREVMLTLYFIDAKVNSSCGMHVHHECRDITTQQKTNLMHFYARCERTIDAFMPLSRKRDNNQYCQSMIEAYNMAWSHGRLPNLGRYYKVNYESHARYGTIEFRQHSGTIEFEKAYHWIVFTANMLTYGKDKVSRSSMNFVERAWTKKHLKLEDRTWNFFKSRMKKLDDLTRAAQAGRVRMCVPQSERLSA